MEYRTLVRANIKQQKSVLFGIFLLLFLVSLSLGTIWNVWSNAECYVTGEAARAGFGNLTAWISGIDDVSQLTGQMEALADVERTDSQPVIFSNYEIRGQESDSEGQLIKWTAADNRYRFFEDDLSGYAGVPDEILPGTVYVSASLVSMFGAGIGDTVAFSLARSGGTESLTIAGFYEDPFMGSSMIGMKGFLVSDADFGRMAENVQNAGIDALARSGHMIHIFQASDSGLTTAELNTELNSRTDLPRYTEFVHSAGAITGFMLILQNAFSALLSAFALVLLIIVLIVLGHSVSSTIEAERKNLGILKSMGASGTMLQKIHLLQYGTAILPALIFGLLFAAPAARILMDMTLTTTGIRIPSKQPWLATCASLSAILLLLTAFIWMKTKQISRISPIETIQETQMGIRKGKCRLPGIGGKHLAFSLALRQLLTGKKKYFSACMIALLLAFFASLVGRMDGWLGPDGKGMMDAFNPADHDIGIQMFGSATDEDALSVIRQYTEVTDHYLLAMPGVAVEGIDYTANVISDPERFHILEGRTCYGEDEIVVTETVAENMALSMGDRVLVSAGLGEAEYVITGIYSCANDMGDNIGMSREGYLKIGQDSRELWCHHYFLADTEDKDAVTDALESAFGGDAHIHENTWPGLFSIISAMRYLVLFMYGMVALFILTVTAMTGTRLLAYEKRDIGIYKALGCEERLLRISFALRFGLTALAGSLLGAILAAVFTDPIVSAVMRLAGISNFVSTPSLWQICMPIGVVTGLFFLFAYTSAGKMKLVDLTILISE